MKALIRFIKSLDFLGSNINFNINSCKNHKTILGGLFSFIYYLLFFFYVIGFYFDFFIIRIPTGYNETIENKSSERSFYNITKNPFIFGFQLTEFSGKVFNISDYVYPIFIYKQKKNNTFQFNKLKTISCDKILSKEDINLNSLEIGDFICPDLSDLPEKIIKGDYSSSEYSIIGFYYSLCNHDKKNPQCKDPKKLKKLLEENNLWVASITPKVKYFINNEDKPLEKILKVNYNVLSPYKMSYDEYYLNLFRSETDNSYLTFYKNKYSQETIGISKHKTYDKPRRDLPDIEKYRYDKRIENTAVFSGSILLKDEIIFFSRKYKTIGEFCASILGEMKLVGFFFTFFSGYFLNFRFKEYLIKNLVFFEDEDVNYKQMKGEFHEKKGMHFFLNETVRNFKNKKNNFQFSYKEMMKYILCKKERETKIFRIMILFGNKITEKFNILYYIRKLKEIKFLKKLFVDQEDNNFLKLISRKYRYKDEESISENNKKEKIFKFSDYFLEKYDPESINTQQKILKSLIEN